MTHGACVLARAISSRRVGLCVLFASSLALGCERSEPAGSKPSPKTTASSAARAPSAEKRAPEPARAPPVAPCRVMRVSGDVRDEQGHAVKELGSLEGRAWLELGERAELVVRHALSAREFSVAGPARVLPCRNGLEQVLLAHGKFESSKGTGVRPGAELWVATPFGVVRYGDADLEVSATRTELRVRTRAGQAFSEAAEGLTGTGADGTLAPGSQATRRGRPDANALTRACEKVAELARSSAERVLGAAQADVGRLTAAQMRDRRAARASCLKAEAALATLDSAEQKTRLGDLIQRADSTWRGVPRGAPSASPEPTFRGSE